MYTGIVQGLEKILDVRQGHGFSTLVVSNNHNFFHDVFTGANNRIRHSLTLGYLRNANVKNPLR